MNNPITPEARDMAMELYEKINKLVTPVNLAKSDGLELPTHTVVKLGYIDAGNTDEAEIMGLRKQVVDGVFTTIYDDLLSTGHTHIFWRVVPTWLWEHDAAWDKVYLRARYVLFTPKELENNHEQRT
jgi:hypothetical protein